MRAALLVATVALLAVAATGCGGCHVSHETVTVLGSSGPFSHGAGSNAAVSLSNALIGLDRDGRATYGTQASWGDLVVTVDLGASLPGSMFLSMHDVADALVQSGVDLRAAAPGSVLAGASFQLTCASNPTGCIGYDGLDGATASATATVVAPVGTPPALFTLSLDGKVTPQGGEVVAFRGTLPYDLGDIDYVTGSSGDCS